MKVSIFSFGYKFSGVPNDNSGNFGGYVFDCRVLDNPYHNPKIKDFDGRSKEIKQFFEGDINSEKFIENCYNLIELSVVKYKKRGFTNLFVAFGCTGGFHRSVYCSEKVTEMLKDKGYEVELKHCELDN
ncbi:MAG: hypothetical protein CR982_06460 [Candidatus Cloacimonadota bacterium]|nr:MAG: hypothetical protein CR982_06460 [Candidatus Cloacimonadota bacterium]PIE77926.1 MAG: hypothetical protein CSA15_10565 [Candidatus Delongbacteria bacterium]